jgi:hypothetical protein
MSALDYPDDDVMLLVRRERLKRDIVRDAAELSPTRLLGKHPIATMAIAAGAGVVAAQLAAPKGAIASVAKLAGKYLMPIAIGWLTKKDG